jgi:hypothetical protein
MTVSQTVLLINCNACSVKQTAQETWLVLRGVLKAKTSFLSGFCYFFLKVCVLLREWRVSYGEVFCPLTRPR